MDPALTASLLAAASAAVGAFVGYWMGVARAERVSRAREALLLDELDLAVDLIAATDRHPAGRHLRLVADERA